MLFTQPLGAIIGTDTNMLTWEIDAEKVKEYDKEAHEEKGFLKAAITLLKNGMNMNTVAVMLELDESQISQLKQIGV